MLSKDGTAYDAGGAYYLKTKGSPRISAEKIAADSGSKVAKDCHANWNLGKSYGKYKNDQGCVKDRWSERLTNLPTQDRERHLDAMEHNVWQSNNSAAQCPAECWCLQYQKHL